MSASSASQDNNSISPVMRLLGPGSVVVAKLHKSVETTHADTLLHAAMGNLYPPKDTVAGIGQLLEAADRRHPVAMTRLGYFYETGQYVDQDLKHAGALYKEASGRGHGPASHAYASLLTNTEGKASSEATKYFKLAQDQGYMHPVPPAKSDNATIGPRRDRFTPLKASL